MPSWLPDYYAGLTSGECVANAYEHLRISGDYFAIIAIGGELHS